MAEDFCFVSGPQGFKMLRTETEAQQESLKLKLESDRINESSQQARGRAVSENET